MEEYYENLDKVFSEAAKIYDKKILSNFINVNIRSLEMQTLLKHCKSWMSILEIGCGTGEEASKFILRTGIAVTCLEISRGMIEFARSKMEKIGALKKFTAVRGASYEVKSIGHSFDLIYSFNGAFNTEPRIREVASAIYDTLSDNGILIFSVRNKICLGEIILYSVLGRDEKVKDRIAEETYVEVVGHQVKSKYYSPDEILSIFGKFKLVEKKGLAITLPPYLAEKIHSSILRRLLISLETVLSSIPIFSSFGDEVLYVFQK
ncbi:MAG: class I SAM-dependent methyltransferase [Candidatus Thermoplasmatota archaeon]|nr:class I SAM-dependent methyltransferase [Candidatus Thermoplasmatota archaeon]